MSAEILRKEFDILKPFNCDTQIVSLFASWLIFLLPSSNTLRVTRSAAPSTLDSSSPAPALLGKKGKEFEFSQLPLKVEFLECSAKGGRGDTSSADIQDVEKWLAKIAWGAAPAQDGNVYGVTGSFGKGCS